MHGRFFLAGFDWDLDWISPATPEEFFGVWQGALSCLPISCRERVVNVRWQLFTFQNKQMKKRNKLEIN